MSKTDKTRPWWVRLLDDRGDIREVHRHEHGPCTLPALVDEASIGWRRDGCHYDATTAFWYRAGSCGCPMCTQQAWRRAQRRKERHRWNQALRALDLDGLDDYTG